jgi:fluoroquinolone resistance protein
LDCRVADRKDGVPTPVTESTIRSEDWYARDLVNGEFSNVDFIDVDMTELTSQSTVFTDCTFRNVRFNVSTHSDSAFINCTFSRCNLFNATFSRCKMTGSVFDGCALDLLVVDGGNWGFVGLSRADLSSASFVGVKMREVDLSQSRCQGGTLSSCDLSGASFDKADFSRSNLTGSDLSSLDPLTVALKGAQIDDHQAVVLIQSLGLIVV